MLQASSSITWVSANKLFCLPLSVKQASSTTLFWAAGHALPNAAPAGTPRLALHAQLKASCPREPNVLPDAETESGSLEKLATMETPEPVMVALQPALWKLASTVWAPDLLCAILLVPSAATTSSTPLMKDAIKAARVEMAVFLLVYLNRASPAPTTSVPDFLLATSA